MEQYRLAELVEVSNTSARTIRYYIAERLLPPPSGSGPAAVYTAAHRDRLALIAQLKSQYQSLRAIRDILLPLSDAEVRAALAPADEPLQQAVGAAVSPERDLVPAAGEQWERFVLADGVELHLRADRLRAAIALAPLIAQAQKLFGEDESR